MSGKKEKTQNNVDNSDLPPTFYDKIDENVIIDLTKLTQLVNERY